MAYEWEKYISLVYSGIELDASMLEKATRQQIDTYVAESFQMYHSQYCDAVLWEDFKATFKGWKAENFGLITRKLRIMVASYLLYHGVYTPTSRTKSEELAAVVNANELPKFPIERAAQLSKYSPDTFISMNNLYYKNMLEQKIASMSKSTEAQKTTGRPTAFVSATAQQMAPIAIADDISNERNREISLMTQQNAAPRSIEAPTPHPEFASPLGQDYHLTLLVEQPSCVDWRQGIADFREFNPSEEYKFGGEKYDALDDKINMFVYHCSQVGIGEQHYREAYSLMLKGRALNYYHNSLMQKGLSFQEMVSRTRNFFYGPAQQRIYMHEWMTTTIYTVINENPKSNLPTCVEKLIEQVIRVHRALSVTCPGLRLKEHIIWAVESHPAFIPVHIRPEDTFEGVCSQLRIAAGLNHNW